MKRRTAAGAFAILLLAAPSRADVGLPMLAYYLPPAWLLLIPVIGIEALVGIRRFGVPSGRALWVQALANALSTLAGVPVVWGLATGIELGVLARSWRASEANCVWQATIQAWWILPPLRRCAWVLPVALVVAGLGFFVCSVLLEYAVIRPSMRTSPPALVRRWVLEANVWSYAFLVAASIVFQMPAFEWVWRYGFQVVELFGRISFGLARILGLG